MSWQPVTDPVPPSGLRPKQCGCQHVLNGDAEFAKPSFLVSHGEGSEQKLRLLLLFFKSQLKTLKFVLTHANAINKKMRALWNCDRHKTHPSQSPLRIFKTNGSISELGAWYIHLSTESRLNVRAGIARNAPTQTAQPTERPKK